jgi:hypothetical protein
MGKLKPQSRLKKQSAPASRSALKSPILTSFEGTFSGREKEEKPCRTMGDLFSLTIIIINHFRAKRLQTGEIFSLFF